ncbi:MAG: hypothetical protein COX19_00615 [Desulfobacterales bacterium CG23_combo_of_CG06-09_8_20_14_all_51_8]|nr:MAG: hypothetical protein COX19_00615 [Desulfobacterales bacterium CG23_combo_of_CG06-09_8_20_14_all_51_8]
MLGNTKKLICLNGKFCPNGETRRENYFAQRRRDAEDKDIKGFSLRGPSVSAGETKKEYSPKTSIFFLRISLKARHSGQGSEATAIRNPERE